MAVQQGQRERDLVVAAVRAASRAVSKELSQLTRSEQQHYRRTPQHRVLLRRRLHRIAQEAVAMEFARAAKLGDAHREQRARRSASLRANREADDILRRAHLLAGPHHGGYSKHSGAWVSAKPSKFKTGKRAASAVYKKIAPVLSKGSGDPGRDSVSGPQRAAGAEAPLTVSPLRPLSKKKKKKKKTKDNPDAPQPKGSPKKGGTTSPGPSAEHPRGGE